MIVSIGTRTRRCSLGRRGCCREDDRRGEQQNERDPLVARSSEGQEEQYRRERKRGPREPAESRQQAPDKNEIRRGDKWQPGSGRLRPDPSLSASPARNHSRDRAIEPHRLVAELAYTARGSAVRRPTACPMKVEPVVPVSSTVKYIPICDASPGIITVLKSRVRA